MCVVSNIGDTYRDMFPKQWPNVPANPVYPIPEISRHEFEALRKEVLELKELLKAAKKFDDATGQPDCEMDHKVKFLKQIAEALGVDMSEVLPSRDRDNE